MTVAALPVSYREPGRDVSDMLHQLRSAHLRTMPKISGTMLSVGCAGTWYFDWIRDQAGHIGHHIGLEYYSPKPDDLPEHVEWIANTAANMSAVKSASCELVFSGQNLEHLWPEEVVGFLEECHRVLQDGGWLVIDSPNRLVTAPLNWSHPEHTVELTPVEATMLATLAGFEVTEVAGLWLCRDPRSGEILPLDPGDGEERWPRAERIAAAEKDPDNSFIWWLTARKRGEARLEQLAATMHGIFAAAWEERKARFVSRRTKMTLNGEMVVRAEPGEDGPVIYGPYIPLRRGKYAVEFLVEAVGAADRNATTVICDVVGNGGRAIVSRSLTTSDLRRLAGLVRLEFELLEPEFGVQARCVSFGNSVVQCRLPIRIIEDAYTGRSFGG